MQLAIAVYWCFMSVWVRLAACRRQAEQGGMPPKLADWFCGGASPLGAGACKALPKLVLTPPIYPQVPAVEER